MPEASRLMRLYLLLDEERLDWEARDDAGAWPFMCADMQDLIWNSLTDDERAGVTEGLGKVRAP